MKGNNVFVKAALAQLDEKQTALLFIRFLRSKKSPMRVKMSRR
jgi:hypothetical protein